MMHAPSSSTNFVFMSLCRFRNSSAGPRCTAEASDNVKLRPRKLHSTPAIFSNTRMNGFQSVLLVCLYAANAFFVLRVVNIDVQTSTFPNNDVEFVCYGQERCEACDGEGSWKTKQTHNLCLEFFESMGQTALSRAGAQSCLQYLFSIFAFVPRVRARMTSNQDITACHSGRLIIPL